MSGLNATPGVLNIYAQESWHASARIVGDEVGLLALRDAVNEALASCRGEGTALASDGEGFDFVVIKSNAKTMETLVLPYAMRRYDEGEIEPRLEAK